MRLILAFAIFTLSPALASASCTDFDNWEDAQRALEMGDASLDGGPNPREPDGIACEGNRGYPGSRRASREAARIRSDIRAEQEAEKARAMREGLYGEEADEVRTRMGIRTDISCDDFASQEEAQVAFNADPRGLAGLDYDSDGMACEGGSSVIPRAGGPQNEEDRRPEGSKPFYLNTWQNEGLGVAPREGLSISDWPSGASCPNYKHTTSRAVCD